MGMGIYLTFKGMTQMIKRTDLILEKVWVSKQPPLRYDPGDRKIPVYLTQAALLHTWQN